MRSTALCCGRLHVEYQTRNTNLSDRSLTEMGVAFDLACPATRVSWERDALYASYPAGHLGRPVGTAERTCAAAQEAGYGAAHPTWAWEQDMFDAYLAEPDSGSWRPVTNDFKAMRAHIRRYTAHFDHTAATVSALACGDTAARLEVGGKRDALIVNQQWWYPALAWGNDCGRPVQMVDGTARGEAWIHVTPGA